jgi:hypothetical protein
VRPRNILEVNAAFANVGRKERLIVYRVGCSPALCLINIGKRNAISKPIEVSCVSDLTFSEWFEQLKLAEVEEVLDYA